MTKEILYRKLMPVYLILAIGHSMYSQQHLNCTEEIIHQTTLDNTATYEANRIISSGSIQGNIEIRYFADNYILLLPEFKVNPGSTFIAEFKNVCLDIPNLLPIEDIQINGSLIAGTELIFETAILNNGSVDAGNFANQYYIDLNSDGYDPATDVVLGIREHDGLMHGDTVHFIKNWIAIEGSHRIRALTDGTNDVAEALESDNWSEWISFAVHPAGPNLVPNGNIDINGILIEGNELTFSSTVVNNGSVDAGTFANQYYIDLFSNGLEPDTTVVLGFREHEGLTHGETTDFTKSWTAIPGTHRIRFLTDGTNDVAESIESDNWSEWQTFTVHKENPIGVYGRSWQNYVLDSLNTNMNAIIYQYADSQHFLVEQRVEEIYTLLSNQKEVIINLALEDRNHEYFTSEQFIERVDLILQHDGIANLNMTLDFTLGEENAINSLGNPDMINGHGSIYEYLTFLYNTLSSKYPNHNFKQWFTPRCKFIHQFEEDPVHYDSLRTPYLPNDGWVYDHYSFGIEYYKTITDLHSNDALARDTKAAAVNWASPDFVFATSDEDCDASQLSQENWWNDVGWTHFYNNIAKNIDRGITSYLYMFTANSTNGNLTTLYFPNAKDCHREFVDHIDNITIPYIFANHIPLDVPATRPDWIPGFDYYSCDEN